MALLLIDLDKRIGNGQLWLDTFAEKLPELEIRIWPDPGELAGIEYLAFMHPDFDALPAFPNLKAMLAARPASRRLSTTRSCRRSRSARWSLREATR